MAKKRTASNGTCELCDKRTSKSHMTKHLVACLPEHDLPGPRERLVLLRIDGLYSPSYWLYVEVRASALLDDVDDLLRRTWLECCDHLSGFSVKRYPLEMEDIVGSVFGKKGVEFTHDYDYGSTTKLRGKVVGFREGSIGDRHVHLVARNDPLDWKCRDCDKPAVTICTQCWGDQPFVFCKTHADEHACIADGYGLPVVNSPRMGVCGYTG